MIKRYDYALGFDHAPYVEMEEDAEGGYVSYEDHAAEIARLRATNAKLVEELEEYISLMTYHEPMSTQEWKAWRRKHFENCRAALALAKGECKDA